MMSIWTNGGPRSPATPIGLLVVATIAIALSCFDCGTPRPATPLAPTTVPCHEAALNVGTLGCSDPTQWEAACWNAAKYSTDITSKGCVITAKSCDEVHACHP